jgi:hypothetical protein
MATNCQPKFVAQGIYIESSARRAIAVRML